MWYMVPISSVLWRTGHVASRVFLLRVVRLGRNQPRHFRRRMGQEGRIGGGGGAGFVSAGFTGREKREGRTSTIGWTTFAGCEAEVFGRQPTAFRKRVRPTKHRDCLQRRNKWSLGGLRNGATPPNLMPCRKQAMHTNALGRCRTSVARTMARLHKTCWGRRGTCLSPCSCMHEFLLQALVDETYHREVFRRLDASWTDEHTQLMLDAAGLAGTVNFQLHGRTRLIIPGVLGGAHIDCCDLLSWLFGPEKSARAAGSGA